MLKLNWTLNLFEAWIPPADPQNLFYTVWSPKKIQLKTQNVFWVQRCEGESVGRKQNAPQGPESHDSCHVVFADTGTFTVHIQVQKRCFEQTVERVQKEMFLVLESIKTSTRWGRHSLPFSPGSAGRPSSSGRPCTTALCARCRKPFGTSWLHRESSCRADRNNAHNSATWWCGPDAQHKLNCVQTF